VTDSSIQNHCILSPILSTVAIDNLVLNETAKTEQLNHSSLGPPTWFCVSVHIADFPKAITMVQLKDTASVVKSRLRDFCNHVEKCISKTFAIQINKT